MVLDAHIHQHGQRGTDLVYALRRQVREDRSQVVGQGRAVAFAHGLGPARGGHLQLYVGARQFHLNPVIMHADDETVVLGGQIGPELQGAVVAGRVLAPERYPEDEAGIVAHAAVGVGDVVFERIAREPQLDVGGRLGKADTLGCGHWHLGPRHASRAPVKPAGAPTRTDGPLRFSPRRVARRTITMLGYHGLSSRSSIHLRSGATGRSNRTDRSDTPAGWATAVPAAKMLYGRPSQSDSVFPSRSRSCTHRGVEPNSRAQPHFFTVTHLSAPSRARPSSRP